MLRATRITPPKRLVTKTPTISTPPALAPRTLAYAERTAQEVPKPPKKSKTKAGQSCCFFCCGEKEEESQQLDDSLFYALRLTAILAAHFNRPFGDKLIRNNIHSIMLAKISSRSGDSEIVFVGDRVTSQFGFTHASQLLGRDLMDFFADPIFAQRHKGFLNNFASFGGMLERSTEISTFFYKQFPSLFIDDKRKKTTQWLNTILEYAASGVNEAPKKMRSFFMKGNKEILLDTRFELMPFYLNSKNLGSEELKYSGVYTAALFFSVTNTNKVDIASSNPPEAKM